MRVPKIHELDALHRFAFENPWGEPQDLDVSALRWLAKGWRVGLSVNW